MLKRVLYILVLAISFSCTQKIEPIRGSMVGAISFTDPIVRQRTKASEQFSLNYDFCVYAKYYSDIFTTWSSGTDFFGATGSKVIHSAGILTEGTNSWDGWKTAPNTYYWPQKGSLSFQAYAPYTATTGNTISPISPLTTIISSTGINAEVSLNTTPGSQIDFLYSERVTNQRGNQKWTSPSDSYPNLYGVQLPFHHALCKLTFQSMLRSSLSNEGDYMKITSIVLSNVKTTGTFTQGLSDDSSNQKTSEELSTWNPWLTSGPLSDYDNIVVENPSNISTQISGEDYSEIYLIPQDLDDDISLVITYKEKKGTDAEQTKTITIDKNKLNTAGIDSFILGKNYIFTFFLGEDHKIYFEPYTKDWTDRDLSGDIHYSF